MDSGDVSKETIKLAVSHAIRNCNRNVYEWLEKKKRGSVYTISHTEVRGLVKNWIIRALKDTWGNIRIDRALKEGNLVVSVDDANNCISRISLTTCDDWRSFAKDIAVMKDVFESINYSMLKYDPKDYHLDGVSPVDESYGSPAFADFSKIEKIKFV